MTMTWGDQVIETSGDQRLDVGRWSKARWRLALSLFVVLGFCGLAVADDDDYGRGSGPQPDVARVSLMHGDVSMQRGDEGDWTAATLNTPLVRGDQIATGDKSRMELQLDFANILRLSSRSQAKIADLTRTHIQIQLAQGYANYSMFKGSEADVEIDTPNVAVRPLKRGRYRIQVNSDDETEVIVRQGEAEITTPQGSTTVKEDHRIVIRGSASDAAYKVDDAPSGDDWDHFNRDRDRQIQDAQSWGRTNSYYTGSHDLDSYGHWVFIPGYGWVWQPWQEASWAPYQAGRWVWEPYWGWTWVSYEPWGWAPYHYGRWFVWGGSWVWWPGPVYAHYRPFWAPAFVTFIGFGHHTSFAFGFGSIGWIPVGPFDNCYPWWGRGFNRVNVVNIVNVTNVTNIRNVEVIRPLGVRGRQQYISNIELARHNDRVRGGISGVETEHFGRGDMRVRRLDIRDTDLRDSRVVRGNLPVVPTRESLHAGNRIQPTEMGIQPKQVDRFYTKRQPPAGPQAFDHQADRVQQVIQAHAPNAQIPGARTAGEARGEFRTQPGMVNRQGDLGTKTNVGPGKQNDSKPGPSITGGTANTGAPGADKGREADRGGWRGFGRDRSTATETQKGGTQEGRTMPAIVPKQGGAPAQTGSTETPKQSGDKSDRGGWSKFGDRSGGGQDRGVDRGVPASRGNVEVPRDRGNPAAGQSSTPSGTADRSNDRNVDRGGWQRFPGPGSGGRQNDATPGSGPDRSSTVDRSSGRGNKPPLELNKPIVTPRSTPEIRTAPSRVPDMGGPPRSSEPSRIPEVRSEPRTSGGYDRSAGRSSGGSDRSAGRSAGGSDRGPGRSGAGSGSQDRGGSRGGERGGGGDKGGSKGPGPKSR